MKASSNPFIIRESIAKVKGFSRLRQVGSDFWLGAASQEKITLTLTREKFRIIFFTIIFFFTLIMARAFYLQVVKGQNYNQIAEGNRIRLLSIKAERGIIYDRYHTPLVANLPNVSLYFIPPDLPSDDQTKKDLTQVIAAIIDKNSDELWQEFIHAPATSYQPILIADNLSHEQSIRLKTIEDNLAGVYTATEPRRDYLEGSGLAHILGYVGKISSSELAQDAAQNYDINDTLGKDGVELFYESMLKGKNGTQEIEVDALGKTKKILNRIESQIGASLVLTIDAELQKKLSQSLANAIKNSPASQAGVAIALDPQSGEILSLVSLPGFDNNFFSAGITEDAYQNYLTDQRKPLFNRTVAGTYPPGSIFKPLVALAALEQGIINEHKTFLSTGGLQIGDWFFPDWKYGGHGRVNVISAIANSVNTFFYYIGGGYHDFIGLGVQKITDFARQFYLSKTLGIDLPGEAAGFLPSKDWKEKTKQESWYIGDTYHLAIGQGDILVTPLQVASYTAFFANGGTLYQPHLLKEIINADGLKNEHNSINNQEYVLAKNLASDENIDIIRRALRATVTSGSAQSLQSLPVAVAGKTGTAQVGADKESHAWFTGFAPYDSPRIVITILLENGGEGSAVAVPVFKEVVEWYFNEK
ncbi:penicillin-binding protein 2 [Candidatus Kuenenbacteria bacterium CG_4_9_14_3_um_filter_39_14]|uniref:Penicillin-binding protein 2 n=5 Tax=Candidatus Kueneniibacteriota TaxID=1752740 RepID=A0A2H0U684_9BACT|nr:MAG: penicillin-binding protein 2 [Candidatus Kuenenbacteria bacterium CG23_combo_of_CG06-09_8_20_14_all_39_39]PIR81006.1 MAG: penicillin-binding protein 2 [Candidatus Kuenenbacteria bacterium CG10_big_fil_rev_8_21_14_0_10_39_14]PJA92202.1 MAG: penicillin-binding protein 2 [Candidatus Kuenenbacteria bacterium CG_4_9_14_3_um_filter_39_14]